MSQRLDRTRFAAKAVAWMTVAMLGACQSGEANDEVGQQAAGLAGEVTLGTPAPTVTDDDTNNLWVGVRFKPTVSGTIQGVRFYRTMASSSPFKVGLWRNDTQANLATKQLSNSCSNCWIEQRFDAPIPINANQFYTAGYYMTGGRYAVIDGYYSTSDRPNAAGNLVAPATGNVVGGNGAYVVGDGYLANTWNGRSYGVDVIFAPNTGCGAGGTSTDAGSADTSSDTGSGSTGTDASKPPPPPPPTAVFAGADDNMSLLPPVPTPPATITVSNGDQLRSALAGPLPAGSVIELQDGNYTGGQFLVKNTTVGTAANPIVIRAKNNYQAVITQCGAQPPASYDTYCFRLESSYVILTGLKFTNTGLRNVNVLGSHNRVSNNQFIDAGFSTPASGEYKDAIICSTEGDTGKNIDALVDNNYILRPKNIPFSIEQEHYGITISHNTIEGPNGISTAGMRENMAVKIGCCEAPLDDARYAADPTRIQFNTFKNFGYSDPYFGSSKLPHTRFVYNRVLGTSTTGLPFMWLSRGKESNGMVAVGNFFEDGGFFFESTDQTVTDNTMFAQHDWYGAGNLIFSGTRGMTGNDGVYYPEFYAAVRNSTFLRNDFVMKTTVAGATNVQTGTGGCDVSNNLFQDNFFLTTTNQPIDSCMMSSFATGSKNNVTGALSQSPVPTTATNAKAPYHPEYVVLTQ